MSNPKSKKEILIIFLNDHLAYSPSTLNLFYALKEKYKVQLICPYQPKHFSENEIKDPDIKYTDFKIKRNIFNSAIALLHKIINKFIQSSENRLLKKRLTNHQAKFLINYIKKTNKEIIAIDTMALWCAQQAGKKAHLLSLEISENDEYLKNIKLSSIKSVIIQSHERLNYLFPQEKPRYFIIQNSPKYLPFEPDYTHRKKTDLVYCGSAVLCFGIITCLDFIKDYKEYTLTIKGAYPKETKDIIEKFYSDLLTEKRLIIDTAYLSEENLTKFVSKFRIGFAFYDFYRFPHLKTFNYYTAPSGKVYQYLNSGTPIIGNSLPGFQFINDTKSGVLVNYLSTHQIKMAIDAIEDDYLTYAENAKRISSENDFDKMIIPFLEYITELN
ncbi:hypothetical protein [Mucilaginibacter sp.]|jgi:hypothetical protein|uniref:hypothetical protein n=1 Tax=Mucilaginibacter sp. TaxID=1882438 RepID=UPI00356763E6